MKLDQTRLGTTWSFRAAATVVAVFAVFGTAEAQYTLPPTWTPMTMPTVSFDTGTLKLDVVDEVAKMGVGVYPVLTAAPLGTFEPGQLRDVLND